MKIDIQRIHNTEESGFDKALQLRYRVFVHEQGVPFEIERDEDDDKAIHVIADHGGKTVGCGRIVFKDSTGKIGRVAVARSHRNKGVGSRVCLELMKIAEEEGCQKVVLHAQVSSEDFYKTLGFKSIGERFMEADIEHIKMIQNLK
ncbi:MAG: GNAT family N-acetyltransferase [Bacillota bacterium]